MKSNCMRQSSQEDTKNLGSRSMGCSLNLRENSYNYNMAIERTEELYEKIKWACSKYLTMATAAKSIGMKFTTFKRIAIQLGVYRPNQSGKGTVKKEVSPMTVDGLNNGDFPNIQSFKLKRWLIKHGVKKNQCECCGISEWNGKKLNCALHHKDGNKHNNRIDNLIILCPNCHSQTDTFAGKNYRKYTRK